jgi:hypothetical protein
MTTMTETARIGDVHREIEVGPYTIQKVVRGVAYPRNGNVGRATVYYNWRLARNGQVIATYRTLRDAKAAAANGGRQ